MKNSYTTLTIFLVLGYSDVLLEFYFIFFIFFDALVLSEKIPPISTYLLKARGSRSILNKVVPRLFRGSVYFELNHGEACHVSLNGLSA